MSRKPGYLSLAQVADELRLSFMQVYRLVRRGKLRALKIGGGRGTWRVARKDLHALAQSRRT